MTSIAYVELYTEDDEGAIAYCVTGLGFTPVAWTQLTDPPSDSRSTLLRSGSVQLIVTTPTGTGPVRDYLDIHGDGIADVALACDDVPAAYDRAVRGGARAIRPLAGAPSAVVGGIGAISHTLVPASVVPRSTPLSQATPWPATSWPLPDSLSPAPPPNRTWVPVSAAPRAASGPVVAPFAGLDHIAICVAPGTLASTVAFYIDGFGLERYSSDYVQLGDQAMDSVVVRSRSGGVTITVVEPSGANRTGHLHEFLAGNAGPGVQHLAFLTDDIIAAVRAARERGVGFMPTPPSYYEALGTVADITEIADLADANILADQDEWGYLLQIFTRSPYPLHTLFFELIQRHEARGFGSGNIRALYEAAERDRLGAQVA